MRERLMEWWSIIRHSVDTKIMVRIPKHVLFVKAQQLQCEYCTPGMLATSIEYIEQGNPADREKVKEHISGNYCRCTGYQAIVDAICTTIEERQG